MLQEELCCSDAELLPVGMRRGADGDYERRRALAGPLDGCPFGQQKPYHIQISCREVNSVRFVRCRSENWLGGTGVWEPAFQQSDVEWGALVVVKLINVDVGLCSVWGLHGRGGHPSCSSEAFLPGLHLAGVAKPLTVGSKSVSLAALDRIPSINATSPASAALWSALQHMVGRH